MNAGGAPPAAVKTGPAISFALSGSVMTANATPPSDISRSGLPVPAVIALFKHSELKLSDNGHAHSGTVNVRRLCGDSEESKQYIGIKVAS
jgi:hypothetical protein